MKIIDFKLSIANMIDNGALPDTFKAGDINVSGDDVFFAYGQDDSRVFYKWDENGIGYRSAGTRIEMTIQPDGSLEAVTVINFEFDVSIICHSGFKRGVCRVCGCTIDDPCYNPDHGACWWLDKEETICSHCGISEIDDDADTIHCIHSTGKEEFIAAGRE